jgi:hypothetical protein
MPILDRLGLLFDETGRRDQRGLKSDVCAPNRKYYLVRPSLDYSGRLNRLKQTGFALDITADEFERQTYNLRAFLKTTTAIANLANGFCLPVVIPRASDEDDLGLAMDKFVTGAQDAIRHEFPHREFNSRVSLTGRLVIEEGSRQDRLVSKLKIRPVVALYYPLALWGFSVDAQREQMAALPNSLVLCGIRATSLAEIMYPDVLARDCHTPAYDCSAAISSTLPDVSYCYKVSSPEVVSFIERRGSAYAAGRHSGGLLFLN